MSRQAKAPQKESIEKKKKKKKPIKTKNGKEKDLSIDEIIAEEQEIVDNFHQEGGQ